MEGILNSVPHAAKQDAFSGEMCTYSDRKDCSMHGEGVNPVHTKFEVIYHMVKNRSRAPLGREFSIKIRKAYSRPLQKNESAVNFTGLMVVELYLKQTSAHGARATKPGGAVVAFLVANTSHGA